MDKNKAKKALGVIGTVLLYLFMALCLAAVLLTVFSKRSKDGAVNVFGYEIRVVLSGSMEKSEMTDVSGFKIKDIPVKSLIVTESVPEKEEDAAAWYAELGVGDVLTFRYLVAGKQETITHRIISVEPFGAGYKFTLRGDNRTENEGEQVIYTDENSDPEPANYVIGKVVFTSAVLGNIVYILEQPVGIALVVMVPSVIIIIMQIFRIVGVFSAERRKKQEEREAEKNSEIETLKKRLADLEQQKDAEKSSESECEAPMSEEKPSETQKDGTMSESPISKEAEPASEPDITEEDGTMSEDAPIVTENNPIDTASEQTPAAAVNTVADAINTVAAAAETVETVETVDTANTDTARETDGEAGNQDVAEELAPAAQQNSGSDGAPPRRQIFIRRKEA